MTLLALSTSTGRGSVALERGGLLVGAAAYVDLAGHAERIFAAIDASLVRAGLTRGDLRALACDIGPGSFTGVRVGVASAKGIALALGLPLVGVGSLEAMAAAAFGPFGTFGDEGGGGAGPGELVVAALDARKDEIFVAAFASDLTERIAPRHVPRARAGEVLEGLPGGYVLAGEVWATLPGAAGARGEPFPTRLDGIDLPSAAWVARRARARLAAGEAGDPATVEPLYVRAPDAKPATIPGR